MARRLLKVEKRADICSENQPEKING